MSQRIGLCFVALLGGCYASAGLGYGTDRSISAQASAGLSFSLGAHGPRVHGSAGAATMGAVADEQGMLSSRGEDSKTPGHLVLGTSVPVWRNVAVDLDVQPPIGGRVKRFGESTSFETSVGRYYLGVGQQWHGKNETVGSMVAYSVGPEVFAHTDSRSSDRASVLLAGKVTLVFAPRMVFKALGDCLATKYCE